MNHWIIVPVMLPAVIAPFIVLAARYDIILQRTLSIGATAILAMVATGLFVQSLGGLPQAYYLGDWPAPFGITLVLDRLSGLMLFVASILSLFVILYASCGHDRAGRHFHALFQFQLMGINGAFLTGDVFNLFVFFEVMLIASYGLMLHGGGARRLAAGFQYVAINLIGSTLFLFAVGLIYAVTGTLNMADLALKIATVSPENEALLATGGILLLVVFSIKAAMVPLHWWLPGTYASTSPPVAALFAIMTKVGAYSILRVYTICFGSLAGPLEWLAAPWIMPLALVTLTVGMIGVLAARTLLDQAAFAVVGSMGTLLIALGLFDKAGIDAALYYMIHSTFAGAALFMLAGLVIERRGGLTDRLISGPPFRQDQLLAGFFFLGATAMVGLPPLSGFLGKLMVLDAVRNDPWAAWAWWLILVTNLLAIIGFARAGSILFWKSAQKAEGRAVGPAPGQSNWGLIATGAVLAVPVLLTLFANPIMNDLAFTTEQLLDPRAYVEAVLGEAAIAGLGDE